MNAVSSGLRRLLPVFLTAAVIFVYWPVRHAGFVYDDQWTIVKNDAIRAWTPVSFFIHAATVASPGSGMQKDIYRPLATASFALDMRLWGLAPGPWHAENLLLHLINGWLAGWLAWLLLRERAAACLAAAVFLLHPAQVEAVAWVSQRSTLLCAMGSLASLIFLESRAARLPWGRRAALACWGLAVFSKETALGVPVLAGLIRWTRCPGRREPAEGPSLGFYAGWMLSALGFLIFRRYVVGGWSTTTPGGPLWTQWLLGLLAFPVYLGKLLFPMALRVSYDYPRLSAGGVLWSAAVLAGYLVLLVRGLARRGFEGLCLVWILIALAPVLHWMPIVPFVAERFLYLPMAGLALAGGWAYRSRRALRIPMLAWCAVCALIAWRLVPCWENENRLWAQAVRSEPTNAFAQAAYAQTLTDPQQALAHYFLALAHHPSPSVRRAALDSIAWKNLRLGNPQSARNFALQALELDAQDIPALYDLCRSEEALGHKKEARRILKELQERLGASSALVRELAQNL